MSGSGLIWTGAALLVVMLTSCAAKVRLGIDALVDSDYERLRGARIAVLTNRTGLSASGARTIDLLWQAPGVELVRLLSPEHGLSTDREGRVGDAIDSTTGLPVFSLYGETRRPTGEMLDGLDAVVFDVQDIGARFYTYITTLGYLLEECARHDVRVVVLDRPNPIAPMGVSGPDADLSHLDFIAYRSIPITHGLTVGELASWFNAEFGIGCRLDVVEMSHWSHDRWWHECGVPWIDPSPNIRNPDQALLYPGLGLLEATNVSVGRGTDAPFERLGAPWIDAVALVADLNTMTLPGVRFETIVFTPTSSMFSGELCHGVSVEVADRDGVRPVIVGLAIGWILERNHGDQFDDARILRLLKNDAFLEAWRGCDDPRELDLLWSESAERFRVKTAPYRRYR